METEPRVPNPVAKRVQLFIWMGQILRDPERRESEEFTICSQQISETNMVLRTRGIPSSVVESALAALDPNSVSCVRKEPYSVYEPVAEVLHMEDARVPVVSQPAIAA